MVTLTRADGNWAGDLDLSRRSIALALAGGYAVAAFSAEAEPIHTDDAGLVTATVDIDAGDRKIPGYLARPAAKGKHPVVFVNSEIFGVHEWIKDICRRLAKAGYVALAPDLFVRAGDPSKLTDIPAVMKIVQATPEAQVTNDTKASLKYLSAQPFADMKRLGVTGFCWGGGKTWLYTAHNPNVKAGVEKTMPPRAVKDRPTAEELDTLKKWIEAGAAAYPAPKPRPFITNEAMLRESDVIVLFEPRHFVQLRAAFPRYLDRVVMLGAFLDPPQAVIDDPYQRSVAETEQIAAQVEAALPGLARLLGLPARPTIDAPLSAPKLAIMPAPDLSTGDGERDGQTDRGAGAVRRSDTLGSDS